MTKQHSEGQQPKSGWHDRPDYQIDIKACKQAVRVVYNNETIADSREALLVHEQDHELVVYIPRQDIRMDMLAPIAKTTFCPFKGNARHWALRAQEQGVEIAAWSYEEPFKEVETIKDYIAFYPEAVDRLSFGHDNVA